jgi:hypothetical protein
VKKQFFTSCSEKEIEFRNKEQFGAAKDYV